MTRNPKGSAEEQHAAEDDSIRLKQMFANPAEFFYFYDGEVAVVDGVITIPCDRPEWAQRAYLKGFRCDPDTGEALSFDDVLLRMGA